MTLLGQVRRTEVRRRLNADMSSSAVIDVEEHFTLEQQSSADVIEAEDIHQAGHKVSVLLKERSPVK